MKLHCNCCDGVYNSFDIHFTSACDNKCAHCIDACYEGKKIVKPNPLAIAGTIIRESHGLDDVLFLGGEPCLFLDELLTCIKLIKEVTDLKVYVTSAMPKTCYDNQDKFFELLEIVDGFNISAQHYIEAVADKIRKTKSQYDRQSFYASLPHKERIRINLNIVKPYLYTKDDITACLKHYDVMGFNSIKLSEIQHGTDYFVSFEKTFGINLKSPYSHGCQTYLPMEEIIHGFKTPVLLKRSCFMCEETLKASFADGVKAFCKLFQSRDNKYAVIYEDGSLERGWV